MWGADGFIKKFDSPEQVIEEFVTWRLTQYAKRLAAQVNQAEADPGTWQAGADEESELLPERNRIGQSLLQTDSIKARLRCEQEHAGCEAPLRQGTFSTENHRETEGCTQSSRRERNYRIGDHFRSFNGGMTRNLQRNPR